MTDARLAAAQETIPRLTARLTDTTGTLDTAAQQRIDAQLAQLEAEKGSQLVVLLVPTTGDASIEDYALRVFEKTEVGRKGVDDGVLLLIAKDDRAVRIEVGYGLEGAIPDLAANRVIDEYLTPHFRNGDFAGGIEAAVGALGGLIRGEALPEPLRDGSDGGGESRGFGLDIESGIVLLLFAAGFVHHLLSKVAAGIRGVGMGGVAALIAWFVFGFPWPLVAAVFVLFFFVGMARLEGGTGGVGYRSSGGGGWSGGSSRGSGGGGWSGGGGRSGGGGASGRW